MSNKETALVLRVTACDGASYGGFKWPLEAGVEVVAPDWKATDKCGNGLHGWLYGNGDHSVGSIREDSQWMVVEVALADVVMLGGKVKFPRCVLRFVGDRKSATDYLIANEPRANGVIGASVTVGDDQCAQVGAFGTATAGYSGTATAGHSGTATAGHSGTATAGDRGPPRQATEARHGRRQRHRHGRRQRRNPHPLLRQQARPHAYPRWLHRRGRIESQYAVLPQRQEQV